MKWFILASFVFLAGCIGTGSLEAVCEIPLPTASIDDTDQTLIEIANYRSKMNAACAE